MTTYESGQAGQATPDEDVLAFAVAGGRILVTLNRKHFVRLHEERPEHAGIIVCSFDPNFIALAQRIHAAEVQTGQAIYNLIQTAIQHGRRIQPRSKSDEVISQAV